MNQVINHQESGASYVEMAISLLVFMLIIISVIELLKFSFTTVSIQHVLQEGLETATKANFSTGTPIKCVPNTGKLDVALKNPILRAVCIKSELIKIGKKFGITLKSSNISITGESESGINPLTGVNYDRCNLPTKNNADIGGNIVAICVKIDLPLFSFIPGIPKMSFLVFGRNEQFRFN